MRGTVRSRMMMSTGALAAFGLIGCHPASELVDGGASTFVPRESPADVGGVEDPVDGPGPVEVEDATTVRGFVADPLGTPIPGVRIVSRSGWETVTDANGRYQMPDVPDGMSVDLILTREGYAGSYATVTAMVAGENFFRQTLAPVDLSTDFEADAGLAFTLEGTHRFTIPAGSMTTDTGAAFEGTVFMNATVFDRRTPLDEGGELLAVPGNGLWRTEGGEGHPLMSMGAFQLEFTDANGDVLLAGPGLEVSIDVPPGLGVQTGDLVDFRTFEPLQENWTIQGQGQIVQLEDGQQAWEFSPITGLPSPPPAVKFVVGDGCPPAKIEEEKEGVVTGEITDPIGNPKPNVPVRVIAADQTFMLATRTDAEGAWRVEVPPLMANPAGPNGRPMFIEVDYEVADKPSIWRENPRQAPGPGQTLDWGESVLGSMGCVAGQVLDADGLPVADVNVLNPHGGSTVSDEDGAFCMNVPNWQPSTIYTVATLDSAQGFEPRRVRPEPASYDACDTTCPNQVTLRAYPSIQCAKGEVSVDGYPADGVAVDSFDARYPGAPIFTTLTDGGEYCAVVPADIETTVRVGAGDNLDSNSCGSWSVSAPRDDYAQCDSGWCQEGPAFDCGE